MCVTAKYWQREGGAQKRKREKHPYRHFRDTGINKGSSCERVQLHGGGYLLIFTFVPPTPAISRAQFTPPTHHVTSTRLASKLKIKGRQYTLLLLAQATLARTPIGIV